MPKSMNSFLISINITKFLCLFTHFYVIQKRTFFNLLWSIIVFLTLFQFLLLIFKHGMKLCQSLWYFLFFSFFSVKFLCLFLASSLKVSISLAITKPCTHLHPSHFSLHPALYNTLNVIRTKISHIIWQYPQI